MSSEEWKIDWKDWKSWLILFGIFTLFESFETFRFILSLVANGYDQAHIASVLSAPLLAREFLEVYVVAALVPLFWWCAREVHWRKSRWWSWLPLNIGLVALFVIIHQFFFRITFSGLNDLMGWPFHIDIISAPTTWNLVAAVSMGAYFFFILASFYGLDAYHRWRSEQLVSAQLAQQLAQARLRALQTQLHPHFLFNTLQSIAILIQKNPKAAESMLIKLGDLLRLVLDHEDQPLVTLREELDFTEKYLMIQAIRFGDQLEIEWKISEIALDCEVPTLILQPLVENAVDHGLAETSHKGLLTISSQIANNILRLWVSDNGKGPKNDSTPNGIGLKNIEQRLKSLYGSDARLYLESSAGGGTTALIELPVRTRGR